MVRIFQVLFSLLVRLHQCLSPAKFLQVSEFVHPVALLLTSSSGVHLPTVAPTHEAVRHPAILCLLNVLIQGSKVALEA